MMDVVALHHTVYDCTQHGDEINPNDTHTHETLGTGMHGAMEKFTKHKVLLLVRGSRAQ